MVKYGAWIHPSGGVPLERQIEKAVECGIRSLRSYDIDYSERLAPVLRDRGLSVLAGMHVDGGALAEDWRAQARPGELERYFSLGVPLESVCVGNELREFGDDPMKKRFTARLSFGLANLLYTYREWMERNGCRAPLTYAMEGIVFDADGRFHEHLRPLVDACDIVSVNLYPMGQSAWHGPGQFDESRAFLRDTKTRNNRLLRYELQLRNILEALEEAGKPLILSETGFPSAVGFEKDAEGLTVPVSDNGAYCEAMEQFLGVIGKANSDYGGSIKAVYFYEWRDNLYHAKINNVEHSPIHCAFGLCDRFGEPKFDIEKALNRE